MAEMQSGQPATYSFLVQSSSSPDTPLRFENPANPKQKRRRTSPHDHAVLEAAYQRNSKPDKKERAEIVSQVDLGEKEVQIWFQNRRQNDRRKSKPLEPHELIAHFRNGVPLEAAPSNAYPAEQASRANSESRASQHVSSTSSSIHELLNPPTSTISEVMSQDDPSRRQLPGPTLTPPSSFNMSQQDRPAQSTIEVSASRVAPSDHGRKRSHDDMIEGGSVKPSSSGATQIAPVPTLKKSSSFVRLAMTVDGAVKVRTNNELTPSPPKQRLLPPTAAERRRSSLTRSQSDVQTTFEFKDVNPPIRRVDRPGFGRSRDVRTWEFYCDRDSGDALETQVEAEKTGSAIGAINLIRSSSQRGKIHPLSPNVAKQNLRRVLPDPANSKPKLSRVRSSMARLQSFDGPLDKPEAQMKRPRHERSSSGDSDKENWAPGTRASQNPLRRMHPSAPRSSVLLEHGLDQRPQSVHGHPPPSLGTERITNSEHHDSSNIQIAADTPGKAKGDDLDCIQGLLSLSQGAWR